MSTGINRALDCSYPGKIWSWWAKRLKPGDRLYTWSFWRMEWNYSVVVSNDVNDIRGLRVEIPQYPPNDGGYSTESIAYYRCRPLWYHCIKTSIYIAIPIVSFCSLVLYIGKHLHWD